MARRGGLESEPQADFNRADCVRHTAQTYSPQIYTIGYSIEKRYLPNDLYVKPGERDVNERHHSVDLELKERLSQFGDLGVELTDEVLEGFGQDEEKMRRAWGAVVVERANQYGLVEIVTAEQVEAKLKSRRGITLAEDIATIEGSSSYGYQGWDIHMTEEDKPILVVPVELGKPESGVQVVDLDSLNEQDPDFMRGHIQDYHNKQAMRHLANAITYNLELHQVSLDGLLPKFIKDIQQIDDPVRRRTEVQSVYYFLTWMASVDHDAANAVYNFKEYSTKRYIKMASTRSAYCDVLLEHLAECPTQTPSEQQRYTEIGQYLQIIASVDVNSNLDLDENRMQILKYPFRYSEARQKMAETNAIEEREFAQHVVDFIAKTEDLTDTRAVLEVLRQDMPDCYDTIVKFQEWLGVDYFKKSRFAAMIEDAVRRLPYEEKEFSLTKVQEALNEVIRFAVPAGQEKFKGVSSDYKGVYIYNRDLLAILPLLVVKQGQAEAKKNMEQMALGDYYKKRLGIYTLLESQLSSSYVDKVKSFGDMLESQKKDKKVFAKFMSDIGITDQEMAHIAEITGLKNEGDHIARSFDMTLYMFLFNTLVMDKTGQIDMHSPVFKEFLASFYRSKPESFWEEVQL